MAVKNYSTVNGMLIGETSTAPGARPVDYMTDALGSIIGTIVNGTVQNTYRYAGYGQQVSKTGAGVDPKFLWAGEWGYRGTVELVYIRLRHFCPNYARWDSRDQIWPAESAYMYGSANPTTNIDPSGLFDVDKSCKECKMNSSASFSVWDILLPDLNRLCTALGTPGSPKRRCIVSCLYRHEPPVSITCLLEACSGRMKIKCNPHCPTILGRCPSGCVKNAVQVSPCGYTDCGDTNDGTTINICCKSGSQHYLSDCCCPHLGYLFPWPCDDPGNVVIHELLHACFIRGGGSDWCNEHEEVGEQWKDMVDCIRSCIGGR